MVFNFGVVAALLGTVWLGVLTWYFWKMHTHYSNLIRGASENSLQSILEDVLKEVKTLGKHVQLLRARCDKIEKNQLMHIQKIGLLRFNPFNDTGGNQSFILTLLDANDSGVVISGLYSRSGTRWYAKRVIAGKGIEHELSDEEKKALKETSRLEY